MAVTLVKKTDITTTRTRAQDDVIQDAQKLAFALSQRYNVPSFKYAESLGICYLVSARRRAGNVDSVYRNETAILYHNAINSINKVNLSKESK